MARLQELPVLDEERLAQRAKGGDAEAFGALYQLHFDRIFRYIAARVGSEADAEDLASQTFLKALEASGSFQWRGAPYLTWLFRIAHNLVVDYYRKQGRRPTAPLDESLAASGPDPEAQAITNLSLQEVARVLTQMTEPQRQVIALRFGAGLSLQETARVMGRREGAVKALQHSALRALRRLMAGPARDITGG